ncbi:MAG: type II secretion system protein [Puniceicoccales bacterium]
MRTYRRSAFTLIELLMVLAVLGVLAGILFPVVGSVRRNGQLAHSLANVRSIGSATKLYAQDHQGMMPVWHDYNAGQYWWQLLRTYLDGEDEVFHSPAHEEFDGTSDATIAQTISYGWNYSVMGRHVGDVSRTGDHVLSQFVFPSQSKILVLTDGPKTDSWGYIAPDHPGDPDRYGNGKVLALFLDGHVDAMDQDRLLVEDPYFIPVEDLPEFQ